MMKLTCAQMETLYEAYLLDTLSQRQQRKVKSHIEACSQCREALEQARARLAQLDAAKPIEPPVGLAARTLAHIAAEEAAKATQGGRLRVRWGYVFAVLLLAAIAIVVIPALDGRTRRRTPSMANNLKQFGIIYRMYANEAPGEMYPPVAEYDGVWVPDLRVLYPEYLTDLGIVVDPDSPPHVKEEWGAVLRQEPPDLERAMRLMAQTYVYHGWISRDAEDVEAIKRFQIADGRRDRSIITETKEEVYRLREGVERFMITDINNPGASAMAQSTLPIMVARPQSHRPGDGPLTRWWRRTRERVFGWPVPLFIPTLFMDGHVEFIPVEEAPPNVAAMLELLPETPAE